MKKVLLVLFLFIIFISGLYADEYVISTIQCLMEEYGTISTEEINFKYDDEKNLYYLQWSKYAQSYWFYIYPSDLEQIRANLKKAKEWEKIAKDNKTNVTKEIPNSAISVKATMKSSNDWYTTRRNIPLNFFFACDVRESFYTLIIRGGAEKSTQNEFIDIEFNTLVFDSKQISDFSAAISHETVEQAKIKHQQGKKAADLFQ